MKSIKKPIVIVGAGFGGMTVASNLKNKAYQGIDNFKKGAANIADNVKKGARNLADKVKDTVSGKK